MSVVWFTFVALAWSPPAFSQDEYPPDIEGEEQEIGGAAEQDDGLPATGANLILFATSGVISMGAGVFILHRARARRRYDYEQD